MLAYEVSGVIGFKMFSISVYLIYGRVETTTGRLIFNHALFPELWQYEKTEDGTYY